MEFEGRAPIGQQLNMAPLIDVVLLLLIFFMLTSTFYTAQAIELQLPSASTSTPADDQPVVVALSKAGEITVNGSVVAMDVLIETLRPLLSTTEKPAVTLKTEATTSVQQMLDVMDAVRAAGGQRVAIATEKR
ncbi:MAG: biopolymer transporter ExbD [Candidatus Eisenbacteria bacterium]|uniref:Biopolymer transporter ExbD n=1 Tax=Eiseniibacteriota bacterium TaxID=2212470 RepID=A0A7Y2E9G6_UNCEI|nr:biopolymer transporter ExbD [Candidatus Eisenbacteria bacterium]